MDIVCVVKWTLQVSFSQYFLVFITYCTSIFCNGCKSHLFVSLFILTALPLLVWNNLASSVWSRLEAILKLIRPYHPGILDALLLFYLFQFFLLFASFCQTLIQKFNTCTQVLGFYFFTILFKIFVLLQCKARMIKRVIQAFEIT